MFCLQLLYKTLALLRRIQQNNIITVHRFSCKVPVILVILIKLKFYRFKKKIPKNINFMKIHPVGAKLFDLDRWTDRHDLANSHFLQFCKCA